jgi:uncharacterized protein
VEEQPVPKRDGVDHGVPAWAELNTSDVEMAKAFYARLFGWQWIPSVARTGGSWTATLRGELVAGLSSTAREVGESGPAVWITYIGVDNVDETTAKAKSAGARIVTPPVDAADAGRRSLMSDPAGAVFGMWQAGDHKGAGLVGEPGAMTWNEVYAPDTDAAVAFYTKVFGWEVSVAPIPGAGSYITFMLQGAPIGGAVAPILGQSPQWQMWFGSADVDASAAQAEKLGATVLVAPTDSPSGRFLFLRDPSGAPFSITQVSSP